MLHLFLAAFNKFRFQNCYRCQVNRSRLIQHSCFCPPEENYVDVNFFKTFKTLFDSQFLEVIQMMLCLRGIKADDMKVKSVAEAMMIELKSQGNILGTVNRMREDLVNADEKTLTLLDRITAYWEYNS